MSAECHALHQLLGSLPLHRFPFDPDLIPKNGIYVLFESGETAHGGGRIVRVGTHTGERQLNPRLEQHFCKEHKDRSVFRKNIGRALLQSAADPFLADWNLDLTTKAARLLHGARIDQVKQAGVERDVTAHVQHKCRFAVIRIDGKFDRLKWESRMVSTIAACDECGPSAGWLGHSSPHRKIRDSGLWQVNELHNESFTTSEFKEFEQIVARGRGI